MPSLFRSQDASSIGEAVLTAWRFWLSIIMVLVIGVYTSAYQTQQLMPYRFSFHVESNRGFFSQLSDRPLVPHAPKEVALVNNFCCRPSFRLPRVDILEPDLHLASHAGLCLPFFRLVFNRHYCTLCTRLCWSQCSQSSCRSGRGRGVDFWQPVGVVYRRFWALVGMGRITGR